MRLRRKGHLDLEPKREFGLNDQGYVLLNGQRQHPLHQARHGRLYAHRAILYRMIGPGTHPCHWCRTLVTWEKRYPVATDALTVDHVDGNKANNNPGNLVPSCASCNLRRGRMYQEPGLLTGSQAASLLGFGPSAVRRWVERGLLPVVAQRRYDRAKLFSPSDVESLIATRRTGRPFADKTGRIRVNAKSAKSEARR